ncbi:hypothetical protein DEO72_LG10g2889 [Vigna unguiculata]|uniref:Uncharacterized protein n=1 Tax=Vigna unguiculata TaxID=3917 RepID=A0A4D6NG22_VIGUN|nr:hypothetical protein DEO72_LG10g2889 [Vigna unguiculata]
MRKREPPLASSNKLAGNGRNQHISLAGDQAAPPPVTIVTVNAPRNPTIAMPTTTQPSELQLNVDGDTSMEAKEQHLLVL